MKNSDEMRKAVWPEYFHLSSDNESPGHGLCSKGSDSWCKFHKVGVNNGRYDHSEHTHLPKFLMDEIKPIFRDLSSPNLLRKCLHGGTQNPSEPLNKTIWSRIPKSTFVMRTPLELGVYKAVASFNKGNISKCEIFKKLDTLAKRKLDCLLYTSRCV